jgi:competence protein ComGC
MADYRDLAAALGGGYGQDTGGITPDTLATLRNGKTASATDLLGMLKAIGSGSLSNLESLVRGGVAQIPGAGGDLEGLARMGINKAFGAGGVNVSPTPVLPTTTDILGMMPRATTPRQETTGMEELGGYMSPATAKLAGKAIKATEGLPVGMSIKPINLNKGIYKPELTMEEMLKVKDIPTVDRIKQSIDLVGEKEFERMVNAQYSKYKPSDVDQEAMLVESVTLDILGKAQRSPYPQQAALDLAQQRAALPVEQGGLGLPANNTAMDRAKAMGFDVDAYHSTNASDITKFDLGKSIRGEGTSVALTPENAQAYGNITYPLKIDQQKIFDPTNKDQFKELKNYVENLIQQQKPYDKNALSFYPFTSKKVLENLSNPQTGAYYLENEIVSKSLKDLGYSGSIGMESGQSQLKIFDPDKIRSRFAAFDPFRKDVATATAMGVALPDLLAAEKEDK